VSTGTAGTSRFARRAALLASAVSLALASAGLPAAAATFGVPTNLSAAGLRTAASTNPPGYLTIQGRNAVATRGDTVHQMRLFIEVTGSTLDVRIFDPGNAASGLDETFGGAADGQTVYTLFAPSGAQLSTFTIGVDTATTDNRLVRFRPANAGFCVLNTGGCTSFTGLAPGLYELRIRETEGDDTNTLGVDIRDGSGGAYAVYTTASSDGDIGLPGATETTTLVGVMAGAPISAPMILYPLVDRGCSVQVSNFDSDGNVSASLTDTFAVTTALGLSGNGDHVENTVIAEPNAPVSIEVDNYGIYTLTNDPGTNANLVDWRIADFQGWANNPALLPRNPTSPMRIYLPNDDVGTTAPAQPSLHLYARVESGENPPQRNRTTTFLISAVLDNPTAQTLTNVEITVGGLATGFTTASEEGLVNGVPTTCTLVSGTSYRRCTLGATVPAGSVATFRFLATITPAANGTLALTGAPSAGAGAATSTVWAQYTPAFSSATFPRTETRGPLCPLWVNVVNNGPALAVTRATIRGLRVDTAGGVVEFATGSQRNTASFALYATDDPSGRGARVPLTAAPVSAPVRDSVAPVFYRVATGPIASRFLVIEETDGDGRRRAAGPFAVDDPVLRAAFDHLQVRFGRLARRGHGESRAVAPEGERNDRSRERGHRSRTIRWRTPFARTTGSPLAGLKIRTRGAGWVEVPLAELEASGLPHRRRAPLRLTSQGRAVPFEVVASASGATLRFRAERLETDFAGENAYLLTWRGAPPPLRVRLSRSGEPVPAGFARVEKNRYYAVDMPLGGDPFVWEVLTSLDGAWPYDFDPEAGDFDLPGLEAPDDDVRVRLALRGSTMHHHVVEASLNGVALGRLEIDGRAAAVLESTVPAGTLREAGNQLEMRYEVVGAGVGENAMAYLEHLDVGVSVREDGPVDWDVTAFEPDLPPLARADYLVLTHGRFAAAAQRLADAKAAEGLRPVVVDVERAYDRYAAGVVEARAIAALLRDAAGPQLRGVVLLGDDSLDPLDHTGMGAASFVPSLMAWDGELGRVPSENLYADVDGDGRPDLAIGRLPAADEDEADALVAKVARQQNVLRELRGRFLMAADNQGPQDAPFGSEANDAAARLPAGSTVAWADVAGGIATARADLASAWSAGAALTQYFGHAGEYVWADERLLGVEDVETFAPDTREGVVFTWTCEAQAYDGIGGPTINEALLLAPRGGALASLGPSGISDPLLQRDLRLRVNELFVQQRLPLGEAVRRAKAEALAARPEMQPVVDGFNLLGDPSVRLE